MDSSKQNRFINETIDPTNFIVQDVPGDNACFYRACSNSLNYRWKSNLKDGYFTLDTILNKQGNWGKKDYSELDLSLWDDNSLLQDELAKEIQKKIHNWIQINHTNICSENQLTYELLINTIHELTIEEYVRLYQHFAGDLIIQMIKTGKQYKSGRRKGQDIIKKIPLADRWGGYPEQCVLSEMLEIPIIVYMAQKFDSKKNKIITGKITNNKPEKGVRYKMYQMTGERFLSSKPPLLLLWKKLRGNGHYYVLYQKNKEDTINKYGMIEL